MRPHNKLYFKRFRQSPALKDLVPPKQDGTWEGPGRRSVNIWQPPFTTSGRIGQVITAKILYFPKLKDAGTVQSPGHVTFGPNDFKTLQGFLNPTCLICTSQSEAVLLSTIFGVLQSSLATSAGGSLKSPGLDHKPGAHYMFYAPKLTWAKRWR